jgi:hypothetical protein
MFQERFNAISDLPQTATEEEALRTRVKRLIAECHGLFGKAVADLIAEGQAEPLILKELYDSHIRPRRASTIAGIERGIASGEFVAGTDAELLLDAIVAPIYLRLLLRHPALTEEYGNKLIDRALLNVRSPQRSAGHRSTLAGGQQVSEFRKITASS